MKRNTITPTTQPGDYMVRAFAQKDELCELALETLQCLIDWYDGRSSEFRKRASPKIWNEAKLILKKLKRNS